MPPRDYTILRYRLEGGDDTDAAANPQYIEVGGLDGLPVAVIGAVGVTGNIVTRTVIVPGIGTGAHSIADTVGGLFELPNIVRAGGAGGMVATVVLIESTLNSTSTELWLFDRTVTPAADDAAHSISDADANYCVGVIPITSYAASALNSTGTATGANIAFTARDGSTSLFGLLVTRGAPTYAAGGIVLKVSVVQE